MSEIIKTILFGTGGAAINFLQNDKEKRKYIIAVDNDKNRHNKFFNDIKIIPPSKIQDYEYDEIIIASFFGLEIREQLLNMGIEENKIILPSKNILKANNEYPFEDEATLNIAKRITKYIASLAVKENIHLHIDWGTLLGVIRDKNIIKWDDDVDFSSLIDKYDQIFEFINTTVINFAKKKNDIVFEIHDLKNKIFIDILSKNNSFNNFRIDIEFKYIKNGLACQVNNDIWCNPVKHIEKLDIYQWEEVEIFIPNDVKNYLTYTYGDWEIPKKNCSLIDYNLNNLNFKGKNSEGK